jgi:hypothetical protein
MRRSIKINHMPHIAAMVSFVAPTFGFELLQVFR